MPEASRADASARRRRSESPDIPGSQRLHGLDQHPGRGEHHEHDGDAHPGRGEHHEHDGDAHPGRGEQREHNGDDLADRVRAVADGLKPLIAQAEAAQVRRAKAQGAPRWTDVFTTQFTEFSNRPR